MGTAALLNVPASLERVLKEMRAKGYDLGEAGGDLDGEAIVAALKVGSELALSLLEGCVEDVGSGRR